MMTPWGNAVIHNGYYVITGGEYKGKPLHRLLFQKYWRSDIPDGYVVHHKDGDKLNNCIMNLQLMKWKGHSSLHNKGVNHPLYGKHHSEESKKKMSEVRKGVNHPNYGKHHSKEVCRKISEALNGENHPLYGKSRSEKTCRKISEAQNTTGYYRVSVLRTSRCKQGFTYQYKYYVDEVDNNGDIVRKRKSIERVNLEDLEKAVKDKGLE